MICNKCNHTLPDDSEFCQYCGNKIEASAVVPTPVVTDPIVEEPNIDEMTPQEAAEYLVKELANNAIEITEKNKKSQPDNEGDADFGLVPEKPIYTLGCKSVDGEKEYLSNLRTPKGEKVKWNRRGSIVVKEVNGPVDIYDIYLLSGQKYTTIYINMYGAKASQKMPAGFGVQKTQSPKTEVKPRIEEVEKPKFPIWDIINIFVLLLATIISGVGRSESYYSYLEELYATILVIGMIAIILKIIAVIKFKNNIIFTSIISCGLLIMTLCSLGTDEEFGPWICIFTLYLFICELCKIIKVGIEKYHGSQSYKLKCYKKINLINEYREKGVITQEEFDETREQIVSKIR